MLIRWDLQHLLHCRNYLDSVTDSEKREMARQVLNFFEAFVLPNLSKFKEGFIHNDTNDLNLLIEEQEGSVEVTGIIDFGDCVHSYYIFELGILLVYAMIDRQSPVEHVVPLLSGYLSRFPVTQPEFDILYYVVLGRLAQSAVNGQ